MTKKKKPYCGKPELQDGYVRIANELWQALIDYDFTAAQMKILAVIIRETYGYNRKSKDMSISYLSKATGISERQILRVVRHLIRKKVVVEYQKPTKRNAREIGINKYYFDWLRGDTHDTSEVTPVTPDTHDTSEVTQMSGREVTPLSPKPIQYKDNIKDNTPPAEKMEYSRWEAEMFDW